MPETIAVIGLGAMGGRAAARLADSGLPVRGFDPAPAAYEALADFGAPAGGVAAAQTPDEAAREAGVVLLSLPRPDDVLATMRAVAGDIRDSVIVDTSTIDPETARAAAGIARDGGGVYVDAPVLGRPQACGRWTLVAGGPEEAIGRVTPMLEASLARQVVRVGDVGAGSAVKIMNNLMFGAINTVTAEVLTMCQALGLDPAMFASVVAESGAATVSGLFRELAPKIAARDFSPTFSLALLDKDTGLAVRLAEAAKSPAFVARCVDQVNQLAMYQGLGAQDSSAVSLLYEMLTEGNGPAV